MASVIFKTALIQPTSGDDVGENIEMISAMIREAHDNGAEFILTPETVSLMEMRSKAIFEKTKSEDEDQALAAFRALADELDITLLIGSLPIKLSDEKIANRSFLINSSGRIEASYDKIHMFDVDLGTEKYRESKNYQPGTKTALASTPWGPVGLTVCYDVRFPQLYRALAKAGAKILTVPSAFARPTGAAHWHVLLRARAIENGCFVLAPAQCGVHGGAVHGGRPPRKTYGHSLIISPWGEVIADGGEEAGILYADIDMNEVDKARGQVPSLEHDRPFDAPTPVDGLEAAAE